MFRTVIISLILLQSLESLAQQKFGFQGQFSAITSYAPDNQMPVFAGGRYLPQLNYSTALDSNTLLDFELTANLSASGFLRPYDSAAGQSSLDPYRIWARLSGDQYEVRMGLQKIDFGSATLIRPIQWFNQIDPRDPLQLTNGVYGLSARYYFLNNVNLWVWGLLGNEMPRGLDVFQTRSDKIEYGGRLQFPLAKGELALSYHNRVADNSNLMGLKEDDYIPEDRYGLDGKWDLGVGLWFEASHIRKRENHGMFSNQSLINLGADYTFSLGNGLYIMSEHLLASYDREAFAFNDPINLTALMVNYPLGLFDQISILYYHNWDADQAILFLNYNHQFKTISAYLMAFYNPEDLQGIQQNELVNNFAGPGLRLMLVYNH